MKLPINNIKVNYDPETSRLTVNGREFPSLVRKLGELNAVIFNKNFINKKNEGDPLYYMYRGVGMDVQGTVFDAHEIRYDITIMMDYDLGGEYNKTLGHYHPIAEGALTYPEIYEVLRGEVTYILQSARIDNHYTIKLIRAKKGDRVIIPPGYGHVSVNTGKDILIEANLVNRTFSSEYKAIEQTGGAAVYLFKNKNMVMNHNYQNASVSYINATGLEPFDYTKSLFDEYISHPERFEFLNRPSLLANGEYVKFDYSPASTSYLNEPKNV